MSRTQDSNTHSHRAKVEPGHPLYKECVAEPMMAAIDAMPAEWRRCVHDFGYVNVYLAWRSGWTVEMVRAHAARNGGYFAP